MLFLVNAFKFKFMQNEIYSLSICSLQTSSELESPSLIIWNNNLQRKCEAKKIPLLTNATAHNPGCIQCKLYTKLPLIMPIVWNFLILWAKTHVKIANLVAIVRRYTRNSTTPRWGSPDVCARNAQHHILHVIMSVSKFLFLWPNWVTQSRRAFTTFYRTEWTQYSKYCN